MFERFTERARTVTVLAQEEARTQQAPTITTGHLLIGLAREEEGLAAHVLKFVGFNVDNIREAVNNTPIAEGVNVGEAKKDGENGITPFTSTAKKALELALREALGLGHNYIGTEHILLGLTREPGSSIASTILQDHDIRSHTVSLLRRAAKPPPPQPKSKAVVLTVGGTNGGRLPTEEALRELGYRLWSAAVSLEANNCVRITRG
jgi:ATP-dependent Clp protease ATP-binding subunit ClpC